MSRIRRIADDDGDFGVVFHDLRLSAFVRQKLRQIEGKLLRFFQRISEKHAQTLAALGLVTQLAQLQTDFEMRHGVGGHHQFKAVQTRQQRRGNVFVPQLRVLDLALSLSLPFAAHRAINRFDDGDQKGSGSGRGVENADAIIAVFVARRIGQTQRTIKFATQQRIDSAHDEIDDGFGRVINAALHARAGVVFFEEGFVEVNYGVLPAAAALPTKVGQYVFHRHDVEPFDQFDHAQIIEIDAVRFEIGRNLDELAEQFAQKRIGFGNHSAQIGQAHRTQFASGRAPREKPVSDGLRNRVGELFFVQIGQQRLLKRAMQLVQFAVAVVQFQQFDGEFFRPSRKMRQMNR